MIPTHIAARFYTDMKKFAEYEAPDESGGLEGQFAAPVGEVLSVIGQLIENELKTMLAYKVYAASLRGEAREGVAEEFEEHAENELEHAEFLMRRAAVLGGAITFNDIPAPPPDTRIEAIVATMIRIEQEGIAKWRVLHSMMGENPMKFEIEAFMAREQHHLDELWQLVPYEARAALLNENNATAPVAQAPAKADEAPPPAEKKAEVDPRTQMFIAQEQEGLEAEQGAELQHLRESMRQAGEELGLLRQQQQETSQQAEQLSQQVAQAQAQAQAAQAQAMQEVTSAHDVALQRGMEAAQSRIAFQNLRGQLLDLGSQEPPDPSMLQAPPEAQMNAPGMQADAMASASGQVPQAQGNIPEPASGTSAGPNKPQQPAAGPMEAQPGQASAKPGPGETTKEGAGNPLDLLRMLKNNAGGAALGGLVGGAYAGINSASQGGAKLEAAKRMVEELEAAKANGSEGGIRSGMRLMGAKADLARREFQAEHPVGAALMGAITGASLGARLQGPVESIAGSVKRLQALPQEVG